MLASILLASVSLWTPALAGAITFDQVTTQMVLALDGMVTPGFPPRHTWETNTLPGMQSLGGRLAWHSLELGSITWALHSHSHFLRQAAKVAAGIGIGGHVRCGIGNIKERKKALDFDKANRPKGPKGPKGRGFEFQVQVRKGWR